VSDINLTDPIFHNEDKAREHFEKLGWPDGPFCPHCGETEKVYRIQPGKNIRPGLHHCNSCDQAFTITVGSVMESSHLPLTKWALGFHLMASSKKGVSAKQLQRQLGIGYRAAWFMAHRIRTAMTPAKSGSRLGGEGKVLESDETFVGGKAKTAHKNKPIPKKHAVHALVERGGRVSAKHVADVTAKTLGDVLEKQADAKSALHTDDSLANLSLGTRFADHRTVAHTLGEYVSKDGLAHTQTVESFFAIMKRGVMGTFHSVSEQHLQRYCDVFAFRWNTRSALGIEDTERAALAIKGAKGKRLTYRQPDKSKAANNQTEV
jgi:transposase-like protein